MNAIPQEITDLMDFANRLPPGQSKSILETLAQRLAFVWNKTEEAFIDLQIDVKYLMFDLEATRRERDTYYRTLRSISDES